MQTPKILPGSSDIYSLLDHSISSVKEGDVLVVTSKVVALCENRVVNPGTKSVEELVAQESEVYFPLQMASHMFFLSMVCNTLLLTAGIDSSNANGQLVLLPENSQKSANEIRKYLADRFGLQRVGVVITDSTSQPLRRGTLGVALAHSGFLALRDYRGTPDIFGEPLKSSQSNVVGGLAAAAVTVMGEGSEQTPLTIISDIPFVAFQDRDPTDEELRNLYLKPEDDIFAPMLATIPWKRGRRG
ncbi:MAG TPA: coenzyme F420-0:L-glutamate ligase [Candidatus Saccharimonadales bacterium]|nr:coenzyme F420-0:L-glutamate ligase [Candidatus Saccharimonadales bacterium]